jgi:hypothetical protein
MRGSPPSTLASILASILAPIPGVAAAAAIALCLASSGRGEAGPRLAAFDEIVTQGLIAGGFQAPTPFAFSVREQDGARIYVAEHQFARTSSRHHYVCAIAVAPSGKLLDGAEHERRRKQPRSVAETARDFPHIGKRAQLELLGFGPDGAAFGLTFTTSDGKFDVKVTVSNLLPEGVDVPHFDIEGTARRIALHYDHRDALRIGRDAGHATYAVRHCGSKATGRLLARAADATPESALAYRQGFQEGHVAARDLDRRRGRAAACGAAWALYGPSGSRRPGLIE